MRPPAARTPGPHTSFTTTAPAQALRPSNPTGGLWNRKHAVDNTLARLTRYTAIAACLLVAGLLISFGRHATWWLLALAGLAWLQSRLLRREISTSGAPLRMFYIVAWSLLGLAVISLLPLPARLIGDVVIVLVALVLSIGQLTRRTRN